VLRDVVEGYISAEAAKEHYGVTVKRIRDGLVAMPEDFEIQEAP
jgi:hypothetical protein